MPPSWHYAVENVTQFDEQQMSKHNRVMLMMDMQPFLFLCHLSVKWNEFIISMTEISMISPFGCASVFLFAEMFLLVVSEISWFSSRPRCWGSGRHPGGCYQIHFQMLCTSNYTHIWLWYNHKYPPEGCDVFTHVCHFLLLVCRISKRSFGWIFHTNRFSDHFLIRIIYSFPPSCLLSVFILNVCFFSTFS